MKNLTLRGFAAICVGLTAIFALSAWFPGSSRAQDGPEGDDPALADLDFARPNRNVQLNPRLLSRDTAESIVYLRRDSDAAAVARAHGLRVKNRFKSDPSIAVLSAPGLAQAAIARAGLAKDARVREVYPNYRTLHVRHQNPVPSPWNPNDPYFNVNTPLAGNPGAWHLDNQLNAGRDVKARGAWNRGWTGFYVLIGVVDDGVETTHPDLFGAYTAADSWDFGAASPDGQAGQDPDPSPVYSIDNHGTSVSGVAAARGGNLVGVTGASPHAFFAMLRQDFDFGTAAEFADATKYHSSGANTNIKIKNHSYGFDENFIPTAAENAALADSAAAGTIHCYSAGNERGGYAQDSNKKDLQNDPNTLCIGAIHGDDKFAPYSSFGACLTAVAPAAIYTTDRTGAAGYVGGGAYANYYFSFAGTSASSPLAAGILAMVKHAQPALNARFAKHLIARTSDQIDPADATVASDGGWKTNGAGFKFNQNYGFGRLNADKLTDEALKWSGVTPLQTETVGPITVNTAVPDNDANGLTRMFSLSSTTPLEEIQVELSITHPTRGQLEATLQSPSGTISRLFIRSTGEAPAIDNNINWNFTSNAFWGENPAGDWSLVVKDLDNPTVGTWNSYTIRTRMGTLVPRISSLSPSTKPAGDPGFTLTVNGFNLPADSEVRWNGSPRTTTFVSSGQVQAAIPASDIASSSIANVTVVGSGITTNTLPFTVGPSLTVSATSVTAGNSVTVNWMAPPGSSTLDWIGIYTPGADNRNYGRWIYTGGAASGSWIVNTSTTPTTFEFRYLLNNGFTSVAVSPTVTTTAAAYSLSASPTTLTPGQTFSVTWGAPAGRPPDDWIGLFRVGDPNRDYISWFYTGGTVSGNGNLTAPSTPGTYELRYLLNDRIYDVTATFGPITVNP